MYYSENDVIREGDTLNLVTASRVIWRHRYLVTITTAVAVALALVVAFVTPPTYQAEVVVVPAANGSDMGGGGLSGSLGGLKGLASLAGVNIGGMSGESADAEAVLHSHYLDEAFIRRYDLVSTLLPSKTQLATMWFAVKKFRESVLTIKTDKDNGTTTVAIKWKDPNVAAQWANEFVAMANELLRNRALRESSRNIEYLKKQIASTQVVALQQAMNNLIEEQTKELMLANVRVDYAFTIDDPAMPPGLRTWPNRKVILLTGGVLGIVFGAILALTINALRNAFGERNASERPPPRPDERRPPLAGQRAVQEES
jgi:uncharacterized protein involved in exopolysaccharide biosynthesis